MKKIRLLKHNIYGRLKMFKKFCTSSWKNPDVLEFSNLRKALPVENFI